jgi:hypothetical protein
LTVFRIIHMVSVVIIVARRTTIRSCRIEGTTVLYNGRLWTSYASLGTLAQTSAVTRGHLHVTTDIRHNVGDVTIDIVRAPAVKSTGT